MALTDSWSVTVDTWSHPRGLELPGLGCDGGGALTGRGLLGATECAWKLGQAQGSQPPGVWEGCNQWVWVGQSASPEHDTSSLIAPRRTQCCSEEAEGQALPLVGQVEQAGHFSLLGTGLHTRPWLCFQDPRLPSSQDTSPRDSGRVPSSQHVQNHTVSPACHSVLPRLSWRAGHLGVWLDVPFPPTPICWVRGSCLSASSRDLLCPHRPSAVFTLAAETAIRCVFSPPLPQPSPISKCLSHLRET